ncbi:glycogenin glucosyltransferase [Rhizoclosmatium sp. JEL0117]|nr:glycogenin glucosyltransferase [Rhizoclosmatium sp. JEL0117]
MVTHLVPKEYVDALLLLGARVWTVPSIEIPGREKPGDKYQFLYTKLHVWRLEDVYESILFLDTDLLFFDISPITLFDFVQPQQMPFFASSRDWMDGNGVFNTGLQLLKPSNRHFRELLELAADPNKTRYGDQGLLNRFFGAEGLNSWYDLPALWNMNHLEQRSIAQINESYGLHGKFWSECTFWPEETQHVIFQKWRDAMISLRKIQLSHLPHNPNIPVVPAIPETCSLWAPLFEATTIKWQSSMPTLALVSFESASVDTISTRETFSSYGAQAAHIILPSQSLVSLLTMLNSSLLLQYDFLWVLSDAAMFRTPSPSLFHPTLKEMRKRAGLGDVLFVFQDCAPTKTASFLISREARGKVNNFLEAVEKNGHAGAEEWVLWELFLSWFTRNGGDACLQVLKGRGLEYDISEEECSGTNGYLFDVGGFGRIEKGDWREVRKPVVPRKVFDEHTGKKVPESFMFQPSLESRPPKTKAIITLLATAPADFKTKQFADPDWFWTAALFHAYTFHHNPLTKLNASQDIEFAVMVTPAVPYPFIKTLLHLGARVITVPALEIPGREKPGDKYQYVYTKLQLQRLSPVYAQILYIDIDLFYFTKNPSPLFDLVTESPFFGSTLEWKAHERKWGQFNSGLQLFTPHQKQYKRLFEYAKDAEYARYGDQGLLTTYYRDRWTILPREFNTHHLEERNVTEVEVGVGFHAKFWSECQKFSEAVKEKGLFSEWATGMGEVRKVLLKNEEDVVVPPVISTNCEEWSLMVDMPRKSGVLMDSVALISFGDVSKAEVERRDTVSRNYGQQALHYQHIGTRLSVALEEVELLLHRFEWVWLLRPHVEMKVRNRPILLELVRFKEGVIGGVEMVEFEDCGSESASVVVTKLGQKRLNGFIKTNSSEITEDSALWAAFIQEFSHSSNVKRMLKEHSLYDLNCKA